MAIGDWRGDRNNDDRAKDDDRRDKKGGGKDVDGHYGEGGYIPAEVTKLMVQCQKLVTKILKIGKLSLSSIEKAIDTVEDYAKKIDAKVAHYFGRPDTENPKVMVKSYAEATGEDKDVQAHTKVGIFEAGDTAKLCIATAESYAAAEGDRADTYVNTFSAVKGVDTGSIHTYYEKGPNYEKAMECLVAIDWESVYDREWVFTKKHSFYGRTKKEVGDGVTIAASNDAYAESDGYADVTQVAKTLAFYDHAAAYAGQAVEVS